jgi:hypothetical protein
VFHICLCDQRMARACGAVPTSSATRTGLPADTCDLPAPDAASCIVSRLRSLPFCAVLRRHGSYHPDRGLACAAPGPLNRRNSPKLTSCPGPLSLRAGCTTLARSRSDTTCRRGRPRVMVSEPRKKVKSTSAWVPVIRGGADDGAVLELGDEVVPEGRALLQAAELPGVRVVLALGVAQAGKHPRVTFLSSYEDRRDHRRRIAVVDLHGGVRPGIRRGPCGRTRSGPHRGPGNSARPTASDQRRQHDSPDQHSPSSHLSPSSPPEPVLGPSRTGSPCSCPLLQPRSAQVILDLGRVGHACADGRRMADLVRASVRSGRRPAQPPELTPRSTSRQAPAHRDRESSAQHATSNPTPRHEQPRPPPFSRAPRVSGTPR